MAEEEKKAEPPAGAPAEAAAAGKKKKGGAEEKKVGKFTHGDHMVHLLIQKGKKFVAPSAEDRTLNLIIEVEVAGQKQYSTPKDDVLVNSDSPIQYSEHLFFELKSLAPQDAKNTNVTIRVLNRGWIKNELVGLANLDLASIYFQENNKVEHVWVALENPDSEDFENMKGLLKISANVTGPKDNAQKLEQHVGPEPNQMKMFMSPSIKRTFNQLTITIIEAHDLPEYGTWSKSLEMYFKILYGGGNAVKTDIHDQLEEKKTPIMQAFLLPVQTPVLSDRVAIDVFDSGSISDTKIGSFILSAKQLLAEGSKEGGFFMWRSLYGAPEENTNAAAQAMNDNPDIASDWKGKVLMHIRAEENDKPKKAMETADAELKQRAKELGFLDEEAYEVMVEIGQGVTLPKEDKDYKIRVTVKDREWESEEPKEKNKDYSRWSCRSPVLRWTLPKNPFSEFSLQEGEEPAMRHEYVVLIYLLDEDGKRICFWRGALNEFRNVDAQWKWLQLKPDRSYGAVEEDYQAGMISVKMSVVRLAAQNGTVNFKEQNAWRRDPPRRVGAFNMRCHIFQCRDLPAADSDGSSDPFIKIFNCTGGDVMTSVIEDNVNPIFMECHEVGLDFMDRENFTDAPPVVFDVMDADEGYISNSADFLGRCTIYLQDIKGLSRFDDAIAEPDWYDVRFGTDPASPACGQVLCSFALLEADAGGQGKDAIRPRDIVPALMNEMVEKLDYDVFINCLGLRELESIGLLPIQKAFVSFMIKSLTDPKESGQMQNIKTQPGPSGPNPNINSVVKFNIPLPVAELYCPALSCTVYDQVFLGFSQPVVGNFTIPLGKIMQDCRHNNAELIRKAKEIIEELKRAVDGRGEGQGIMLNEIGLETKRVVTDATEGDMLEIEDDAMAPKKGPQLLKKPAAEEKAVQDDSVVGAAKEGQKGRAAPPAKTKMGKKKAAPDDARKEVQAHAEAIQQAKDERKEEAKRLLQTIDASNNVSVPNYVYDSQLRVYREVLPPKSQLFRPVGFNDQDLIKEIMAIMNRIPPKAAVSNKMKKRNSMLAKKVVKEKMAQTKKKMAEEEKAKAEGEVLDNLLAPAESQPAHDADIDEAVKLMQEVYDKTNKHYRRFFEDELEHDKEIFPKPIFYNMDIMRGQSRGVEKSWFGGGQQDESGQESTIRKVGTFKGTIEIVNKEEKAEFEAEKGRLLEEIFQNLSVLYRRKTGEGQEFDLDVVETAERKADFQADCEKMGLKMPQLTDFLEDVAFEGMIKELLTKQTDAIVHLYLIQGYDFASRDLGSPSDPYLIVRCGDSEDNDRDNYQDDEPNPTFVKRLDFNVSFPGAPMLVIEAYDYDLLFGDDLIGKTSIDLDDRFFNPKWQAIDEKPIETRELYHMSSSLNQGMIDMWVDIDPANKASDCGKVWDIKREPENEFEVRLSVMKCTGVPMEDWEGTSDVYIKCFIGEADKQETDTHYRCTTGNPSFNYRLLFNVKTPTITPFVLTMQAWDRDLLKSNDLICQWQIPITEIVRDSKITKGPINVQKRYYEDSLRSRLVKEGDPEILKFCTKASQGSIDQTFILTAYHPDDKQQKKPIDIYLDLRVVPVAYAEMNKVGPARSEPNVEPKLPPPEGRFQLSLNPIKMLNQLCGAALRRKIWCCICCVFCLVVCYYVFPLLASFVTLFGG